MIPRLAKKLLPLVAFAFLATSLAAASGTSHSQDETDIRNLQVRQQEAWNHHDAKAYANLFTEDGDVVNVAGWWWKGRAQIETRLADAYAFVFLQSTLTIHQVQIRFLTDRIAVAHVLWTMVGARTPKGMTEPQQGIEVQVLRKQAGKWLIASFQNTNSIPEVPFSKGPPANP